MAVPVAYTIKHTSNSYTLPLQVRTCAVRVPSGRGAAAMSTAARAAARGEAAVTLFGEGQRTLIPTRLCMGERRAVREAMVRLCAGELRCAAGNVAALLSTKRVVQRSQSRCNAACEPFHGARPCKVRSGRERAGRCASVSRGGISLGAESES